MVAAIRSMLGSVLNLALTEQLNNLVSGSFVNGKKPKGHAPVTELSQAIIQGFSNRKKSSQKIGISLMCSQFFRDYILRKENTQI